MEAEYATTIEAYQKTISLDGQSMLGVIGWAFSIKALEQLKQIETVRL